MLKIFKTSFLISALILSLVPNIFGAESASAAACTPTATRSGNYIYFAFKTVGTCQWNIPTGVSQLDLLTIGGGGGGAARHAGGGGAGGFVRNDAVSVSNVSALQIVVGNGGLGGNTNTSGYNYALGNPGETSTVSKYSGTGIFATINAAGGGAGITTGGTPGGNGGSGGGAYETGASYRGLAVTGQGNNGGYGNGGAGGVWTSGGGGGAGSAGTDIINSITYGNGGTGLSWFSDFTKSIANTLGWDTSTVQFTHPSNTGNDVYFAAGGGGGSTTSYFGAGGMGGGGNGTNGSTATSASANSGSGGGGAGCCTLPLIGGNGGSGVVLIRTPNYFTVSLTSSGILQKTTKNSNATTLTATTTSTGTVTFYANGRIINGCKNVAVSGTTATCLWRPLTHGQQTISATYTSTDPTSTGIYVSPTTNFIATKRTTAR
jgi:hypothetical protein